MYLFEKGLMREWTIRRDQEMVNRFNVMLKNVHKYIIGISSQSDLDLVLEVRFVQLSSEAVSAQMRSMGSQRRYRELSDGNERTIISVITEQDPDRAMKLTAYINNVLIQLGSPEVPEENLERKL